jgi:hypothetical protein
MAGSFGIFRQYEKAALAGLAIMAMLAFFVLPPILQMGAGAAGPDPLVVSWTGGGLRESGLQREVVLRKAMNQFLVESLAASGQDPSRMRLADDEKDVVDTLLLAKEAEANGIVVSNSAINQFLAEWTNDLVRPEQLDAIVSRIGSRIGASQEDVFNALRTVLMARRMETLLLGGVGFDATPPGGRWDYYRRLEQGATIEAIPVVVETFAPRVADPSEGVLRAFYDTYKNELPEARSADPGFRQPHRVRYDYLVAKADAFRDEEAKKVTDEQIQAFYEDRKASLFKVKPAEAAPAGEGAAAAPESTTKPAEPKAEDAKPTADEKAPPAGAKGEPAAPEKKDGAASRGPAVQAVAFRQPAAKADPATTAKPEAEANAAKDAAKPGAAATTPAQPGAPAETKPAADPEFEPLEKVKDDIRRRLADEAADKRIAAIFDAVKSDVAKYAESMALWQVAGEGAGPAPTAPDVKKIAATQGLEGGTSDLINASQAIAAGGIGGSFEFSMSREFGMRQQRWIDMLFGATAPLWQAVTSRDVEGNRYVSWKVEDQPDFTPSFQAARADVLRAWKIVEARSLALRAAEELADKATGADSLEPVAATANGLEVIKAGPFTWLSRGTAPFGAAPVLSQPDGVAMPGAEFMQAVFSLEPGKVVTAFNEPKTVCYCLRLIALEPGDDRLRELFLAASKDPRRLAAVADDDTRAVYDRWMKSLEKRHAISWKRDPRGPEAE